jgi:hypothetical protein
MAVPRAVGTFDSALEALIAGSRIAAQTLVATKELKRFRAKYVSPSCVPALD